MEEERGRLENQKPLYRSLNSHQHEIRLLRLLPKRPEKQNLLECELQVKSLKRKPQYEALSYVWGDPSAKFPIAVNGRIVWFTISLFQALCSLRDSPRRRRATYVWADAICINQDDVMERNEQVAMMQHIYAGADTVVVWMGEPTLDKISLDMREAFLKGHKMWRKLKDIVNDDNELQALLGHLWFQRVWVIQEVVCAKRVILTCGKSWTHWDLLVGICRSAVHRMEHRTSVERLYGRIETQLIEKFELFRGGQGPKKVLKPLTPLDAMCIFAGAQSTDSRDQVYGLLGVIAFYNSKQLAQDVVYKPFPVDYNISEEQMYRKLAHHHIAETQNLFVLYFAQGIDRTESLHKGPSWLPDMWIWKERVLKYSNEAAWRTLDQYHATNSSTAAMGSFAENDAILRVTGYVIHKIARKRGNKCREWAAQGSKGLAGEESNRLRADDIICLLSGSGLPFVLRKATYTTKPTINMLSSSESNNNMGTCYTVVGPCIIERNSDDRLQLTFELLGEDGFRAVQPDNDYMDGKFWARTVEKISPREFLLI